LLLAKQSGRQRYWALALECFRLSLGAPAQPLTEATDFLIVGEPGDAGIQDRRIPARRADERALLINYAGANGTFPQVSLASLGDYRDVLRDKIVLMGVTAQGTGDRLFTPFSAGIAMPGVEIHANILNTLLTGEYLLPASDLVVALFILAITLLTLWVSAQSRIAARYLGLAAIAVVVLLSPYGLFLAGQVWPAFSLLLAFGVALLAGETHQLVAVRRRFRESEARRKRSQEQFAMATHEMRTPLASIQASSELLARYSLDDARREQMTRLLGEESQRLGRLVERFLAVERLSAGEMELRTSRLDLPSTLIAILDRLRPVAERKGVQLICSGSSEEGPIDADPELLEFAVSNLLTNAIKYSPAGTAVALAWELDREAVQIHVSDSGSGLTPEQARHVFDRFYRTDSAAQSGSPGFGLGLAIAKEIARHHGGDVQVDSAPGTGSRFTILLPFSPNGRGQRRRFSLR
jgi:signal transduction histidine kinase